MNTPKVKCSVIETTNSTTANASPASPNASAASGNPRLPALLNIIGGATVRADHPASRITGQARSPLASTTKPAPSAGTRIAEASGSFSDSTKNSSAGTNRCTLSRFATAISLARNRAYR